MSDDIVIESRWEALEQEVEQTRAELGRCAVKLDQLGAEVRELREDVREVTVLARRLLEQEEAARARHQVCIDRGLTAVTRGVELLLGDPWVRRGVVAAILAVALGLAGYGVVEYRDGGLTIGHSAADSPARPGYAPVGPNPAP